MVNNGALVDSASGTRSLVVGGNGAVMLAGSNSFSGGTTLNGGVLNIAGDASLGGCRPARNEPDLCGKLHPAGRVVERHLSASRSLVISPAVTATLDTNGNA